MIRRYIFTIILGFWASAASASLFVPMYHNGVKIGFVRADDTIYGLLLAPHLQHLPKGIHGFHLHQGGSCEVMTGHYDPERTYTHNGPYKGDGHLGDLPVLIVDSAGKATLPVLAPRLTLANLRGRTLMIDAGGDNYSDSPKEDGGGGTRIACGEIPYH